MVHLNFLDRLTQSLDDLEQAVKQARKQISKSKSTKEDTKNIILTRLDNYDQILSKQRTLKAELAQYLISGNEEEVMDRVTRINGLSQFILEDAKDILAIMGNKNRDIDDEDKWN